MKCEAVNYRKCYKFTNSNGHKWNEVEKGEEALKIRASTYLWVLTIAIAVLGFAISGVGVYMELGGMGHVGLYLIIFGPLIAGFSGLIVQAASKYEAEGR